MRWSASVEFLHNLGRELKFKLRHHPAAPRGLPRSRAQARQQPGGRRVEPAHVARRETRQQVAGQRLAQLDAPLVEAVDAPHRAAGEDAVLVQRDQ